MQLLLDAHLPNALAEQLRRAGIDCETLAHWRNGSLRTAADDNVLFAASEEGRVFVTFDAHTILPLLEAWAQAGQHHAGVVVVDSRTIRPNDIGTLVRSLQALIGEEGESGWQNRILNLRRA